MAKGKHALRAAVRRAERAEEELQSVRERLAEEKAARITAERAVVDRDVLAKELTELRRLVDNNTSREKEGLLKRLEAAKAKIDELEEARDLREKNFLRLLRMYADAAGLSVWEATDKLVAKKMVAEGELDAELEEDLLTLSHVHVGDDNKKDPSLRQVEKLRRKRARQRGLER
jgi:hypothetical protein